LKNKNKITVVFLFIASFFFLFVSSGFTSSASIDWQNYNDGIAMVEKKSQKLLINFYSDGCKYCKVMDEKTFKDAAVVSYINRHFIPVRVNSATEQKIAEIFKIRGVPDTWFMSETKEVIGHRPGFIPPETMIMFLKYIHTDSYKNMSFKSFAKSQ
jgi:thioredoxin-related protein